MYVLLYDKEYGARKGEQLDGIAMFLAHKCRRMKECVGGVKLKTWVG